MASVCALGDCCTKLAELACSSPLTTAQWVAAMAPKTAPLLAAPPPAGTLHDCSVPLSGADAFLFASLALVAAGVLFGNLSSVWLLIVGA